MKNRKSLRAAAALLTLLLTAALCFSVLWVYFGGLAARAASGSAAAPIYTPEKVRTALVRFVLPVFILWLAAVLWAAAAGKGAPPVYFRAGRSGERIPEGPVWGKAAPEGTGLSAVRGALLLIALILVILGIVNGGLRDVLIKAVNICTECIGLG